MAAFHPQMLAPQIPHGDLIGDYYTLLIASWEEASLSKQVHSLSADTAALS